MILLIDTTTNPAAIGLYDYKLAPRKAGDLRIKVIESTPKSNRKLISTIQSFINAKSRGSTSGITPRLNLGVITAIGVINGPGTFTGVRTGVTIANTIGYALKAPIYTTDTLTTQVSPMITDMVSLLSASNTEVYFRRFKKGRAQGKIEIVEVTNNLPNRLKDGDIVAGDLGEKHCGLITKQEFFQTNSSNRIKNLLDLILCKKIKPQKTVLPLYIKKPNITTPKNKKN